MGTARFAVFGAFIVVFQVSALVIAEPTCVPGFESDLLIFRVSRQHLRPGMRLGRVRFTDCTDRSVFPFSSDDSHFGLKADGVLMVKRQVVLHKGHRTFFIHSWDSEGHKITVPVSVVHPEHHHGHHHHEDHINYNHEHHSTEVDSADNTETATDPQVPVLHFPKSGGGLRRRKRDWVIPPLSVSENHRGPYPLKVAQIRSNKDKTQKIYYSITGPGATEPPVNRFIMDRNTGNLYVTQPLDREETAMYTFEAHAVTEGAGVAEVPMQITVNVIDQICNKPPLKTQYREVPEASVIGFEVEAIDLDEPSSANSDIRYRILTQDPQLPNPYMFDINPISGIIRVATTGLDREKYPQYTLTVEVADMEGEGLTRQTKVFLTVKDSNDNAPVFTQQSYNATVEENRKDVVVVKMSVTDDDEPHSAAWNAVFKIISGDPDGLFTVKTGSNKQEGLLSTAKELDFERSSNHTLLVTVENEIPFAATVTTSTATVVVNVKDVNEAPVFDPKEKLVVKPEDLAVDQDVVQYTASDPDTARKQKVSYKMISDPAGWLNVDKDTGLIKVRRSMDRESFFVTDNRYIIRIGAYDDDAVPATGTGTLIIQLEDVNDNAPTIDQREIKVCNKDTVPQLLSVTDADGPEFAAPYSVTLQGSSKAKWTARMNETRTGIILTLSTELPSGDYSVLLRVADKHGLEQDSTIKASVCDCKGAEVTCTDRAIGGTNLPLILGILGAILLLLLVLIALLFERKKKGEQEPASITMIEREMKRMIRT